MRRKFFALLAGLAVFALSGAPASAAPYMSWGQWTSNPGVAFGQCWSRAAQGLTAAGLSSSQDGRFFHGSNDAFIASVICYDLGNRFIVTIVVAQSGSSSMTTDNVRDQIYNVIFAAGAPAGAGAVSGSGSTWSWSATCFGSVYTGTFAVTNRQSNGTFSGTFAQNGSASYNGTIAGQVQSLGISFTRRWNTPDSQQWTGTLDPTRTTMSGNITGFGGPCTFSANKQ